MANVPAPAQHLAALLLMDRLVWLSPGLTALSAAQDAAIAAGVGTLHIAVDTVGGSGSNGGAPRHSRTLPQPTAFYLNADGAAAGTNTAQEAFLPPAAKGVE
ncbi:hypothetical protein Vretimale_4798 [Volvox reticuliferus]|uniref:Uncharacterized protein n=1 Tax=Volvox reticuliferus TaxID=1737510 RepID=A0A8J4C505_9CHLO|nr:hypothetical protein Vretifemale_4219 [Volvox reticuliferus]GIL99822.1 hypothetical protein Vretimale_4798 [Volvox reticuliferus]